MKVKVVKWCSKSEIGLFWCFANVYRPSYSNTDADADADAQIESVILSGLLLLLFCESSSPGTLCQLFLIISHQLRVQRYISMKNRTFVLFVTTFFFLLCKLWHLHYLCFLVLHHQGLLYLLLLRPPRQLHLRGHQLRPVHLQPCVSVNLFLQFLQ